MAFSLAQVILIIIGCMLMGSITAYLASQRGRDPFVWFFIGTLLGFLGLVILFILPVAEGHEEHPSEEPSEVLEGSPHDRLLPYLTKEWFYLDLQGKQQGPLTFDALQRQWQTGSVNSQTYVWNEDMQDWKRIKNMENLEEGLKPHLPPQIPFEDDY